VETPHVRPPASKTELSSIVELLERAFDDEQTAAIFRRFIAAPGFDVAGLHAVWSADGRALSVVQAIPCEIALLGTWLPGGIITMVGTVPEARGRGFMRACTDAAHRWLVESGRYLGILYGVPDLYPKFGYRPVMPRTGTRYSLPATQHTLVTRPATSEDVPAIAGLFNAHYVQQPCSVYRAPEAWLWEEPAGRATLQVLDVQGETRGYLRVLTSDAEPDLAVLEAACPPGLEPQLLDAAHALAGSEGHTGVDLRLMPDHPLVNEATRRATGLEIGDATATVILPQAGMLAVLDSEALLEQLRNHIEARLGRDSLRITSAGMTITFGSDNGPELHVTNPHDLAHVISGYPGITALRQWGRLSGDEQAIAAAQRVFPTAWPRWTTAPVWGE